MSYRFIKSPLFILLNIFSAENLYANETKNIFGIEAFYSLSRYGFVQARENSVIGDRLNLTRDLGMDHLSALSINYGHQLESAWIDFSYSQFIVQGKGSFAQTFNFNGAVYAPGSTDISKTNYRQAYFLYKKELDGARKSIDRTLVGAGLLIETLNFYIQGTLDASTTRYEKFEQFDRQIVPIPALSWSYRRPLKDDWGYGVEFLGAVMPKMKTPYIEGGNIFFEQVNAELKLELISVKNESQWKFGYLYKFFKIKTQSAEDTNEFNLATSGIYGCVDFFF